MITTYAVDVYTIQAEVRNTLRPHVGVVADILDITAFLIGCFEIELCGEILSNGVRPPSECFSELNIPTRVKQELIETVCERFHVIIANTIKVYDPNNLYNYHFVGMSDFFIRVRQRSQTKDTVHAFREQVLLDIDGGAWYNERIRHFIGLP